MDSNESDALWEAMSAAWEWRKDTEADRPIEIRFCREGDTGIDELSKLLADSEVKCTQEREKPRKHRLGAEEVTCWLSVGLALQSLPKFLKAITSIVLEWQKSGRPFDVVIKDRTLDIRIRDTKDLDAVVDAVERLQTTSETPRLPTKRERHLHPGH